MKRSSFSSLHLKVAQCLKPVIAHKGVISSDDWGDMSPVTLTYIFLSPPGITVQLGLFSSQFPTPSAEGVREVCLCADVFTMWFIFLKVTLYEEYRQTCLLSDFVWSHRQCLFKPLFAQINVCVCSASAASTHSAQTHTHTHWELPSTAWATEENSD